MYKDGRPVFFDLPQKGYQDNTPADWVTLWVDEKLTETAERMSGFWQQLDPTVAPESYLDYIAFLVGLSSNFWDLKWSSEVKREMILAAHYLWSVKGTKAALKRVLDIQLSTWVTTDAGDTLVSELDIQLTSVVNYHIWTPSVITLPFNLPGTFGSDNLVLWVQIPLQYQRATKEFKEAQRCLRNYAPAVVKSGVCFYKFYLGFSQLGDPLFS